MYDPDSPSIDWKPSQSTAVRRTVRFKDLPRAERLAKQKEYGAAFRARRRALTPKKPVLDTPKAVADRKKAKRCYHAKKAKNPEAALERGRTHQRKLREKKRWGPVEHLVAQAVRNVLLPYKTNDSLERKVAYKERNRLAQNLRQRIKSALKRIGACKPDHTLNLVGCTVAEYNAHMHSLLPEGASMKDMACDHIFPLARYDLTDPVELKKAMTLTNMQPLPQSGPSGNSSKRDKLPPKWMAARVASWAWPAGVTWDMLPDNL
tara:strand:- start:1505 stop:2293 length:789 start_codon:yes stop_codon:yes gene_type:complete